MWGVGYRLVDGPAEACGMSAVAYAGWMTRSLPRLRGVGAARAAGAARASWSPMRATSCAGRCARRGSGCTGSDDDAARAAAVDLELRRAALALEDLVAASRGRRAGTRSELVDVGALLDDGAEAWRPLAAAFGASLSVEPLRGRALVRADPVRLAQACGNLVANAVEHGAAPCSCARG